MRWTISPVIRPVSRYALLFAVTVLMFVLVLTTTFSVGRSPARATTAVQAGFQAATGLDADVVAGVRQGMEPDTAFLGKVSNCTHYVHKNGDNTDGKSLQTAWRTIAKAMQSLQAGQTVSNDVYDEGPLVAAHSGTADHPIAVKPAPGASPIIRATSDMSLYDFQADGANPAETSIGYWVVEGFDINKQRHDGAGVRVEGDAAGHAHHIVIRNNRIHDGKSGAAVLVRNRASNVLIDNNHIYEHHRFTLYQNYQKPGQKLLRVDYTYNKPNPLPSGQTYGRFDAHGVSVESESAANRRNNPSVQQIGIQNNKLYNNGGDGVQCIGANDSGNVAYNADASDLDLVDNRIENNAENAIDIKSCQYVSIRGSASPDGRAQPQTTSSSTPLSSNQPQHRSTWQQLRWRCGRDPYQRSLHRDREHPHLGCLRRDHDRHPTHTGP
jgi:hypothetical protein